MPRIRFGRKLVEGGAAAEGRPQRCRRAYFRPAGAMLARRPHFTARASCRRKELGPSTVKRISHASPCLDRARAPGRGDWRDRERHRSADSALADVCSRKSHDMKST
jgi:hypothetical protein